MSHNKWLLVNNCFLAVMLYCPYVPGLNRYFANPSLCAGIILLLMLSNYLINGVIGKLEAVGNALKLSDRKLTAKVVAWAVLVSTAILLGIGPVTTPSAYAVDQFPRIIGRGIINDYSVTKKVHFFYFAIVIYGLLIFNIYQNICFAILNNFYGQTGKLGEFADTLLFVGYSFLFVCVYRQFSNQYGDDLTLHLLKSYMIFMIPAFYLWQAGKLKVQDIRIMQALALFSLVFSVSIVLFFDTRNFAKFRDILDMILLASVAAFAVMRRFRIFNSRVICSKISVISFLGSLSIIFFSLLFEFANIVALKTDKFINIGSLEHFAFYSICWLAIGYCVFVRKTVNKNTASLSLLALVFGLSLLPFQPPLIFGTGFFHINESANHDIPISDFLNFGKIPLFENFPGHGLHGVISSIAYGWITSDYLGAIFTPWRDWLYGAFCIMALFCFIKSISNGLVAAAVAVLMPYFVMPYLSFLTSYSLIGLAALLPFSLFLKTSKKSYLAITVLISLFLVSYKLDIGFAFLAGFVCSSFCVRIFCKKRIVSGVLLYFGLGIAAVFVIFLSVCLLKDIDPLFRIQEFLSTASSDEHWGHAGNGDTEKVLYPVVYFVIPTLSVVCLIVAIIFRTKFTAAEFGVLMCLLFAYYANFPRMLVIHNFMQYGMFPMITIWLWTIPIALSLLISKLFQSKSLFVLCLTIFVLVIYAYYQNNTFYSESPLQYAVGRAESLSDEVKPDIRKNAVSSVFSRGTRVVYDEAGSDHLFHASEIRTVADMLLSPGESFIDFTNQSAAYAWSRRENPTYTVQPPSMLSGELGQKLFVKGIEARIDSVPIAIMPAHISWVYTLDYGGMSNNIRHYIVAEWIYNNYRPLFKYNDFASVWVLNSRYDEFLRKLDDHAFLKPSNVLLKATEFTNSSINDGQVRCHNCTVQMTSAGLRIQPTGPGPLLMDFDKLIGSDGLKSFTYLTLYLSEDNNGNYKVYFTNDRISEYSEQYSLNALSLFPRVKLFDLRNFYNSVGPLGSLRLAVPEKGITVIKTASVSTSCLSLITKADWGYDNFIPGPADITEAHNYYVELLPYVWGQFDTKKAANYADLADVSLHDKVFTWNYSGHEKKPAYVRIELSVSPDFLMRTDRSYLNFGTLEHDKFTALNRYWFKLKEGRKVYLFRVSSDYYWSRGKLNALFIDPNISGFVTSVRLLKGD